MTTFNRPDQKPTREDNKGIVKWGIAAAVILFILVVGFIDGHTILAIPGAFLLVLGGPVACGFAGYGLWKLFTGKKG
jgi:hypothetical protein